MGISAVMGGRNGMSAEVQGPSVIYDKSVVFDFSVSINDAGKYIIVNGWTYQDILDAYQTGKHVTAKVYELNSGAILWLPLTAHWMEDGYFIFSALTDSQEQAVLSVNIGGDDFGNFQYDMR